MRFWKPTDPVRAFERALEAAAAEERRNGPLRPRVRRVSPVALFRHFARSRYMPHQGKRECARRRGERRAS